MSSLSTYKLGVMSTVWYVDAPSIDVATLAVMLVKQCSAPIANYSSNKDGSAEQSQFSGGNLDESIPDKIAHFFADGNNQELVREAAKTIRDQR